MLHSLKIITNVTSLLSFPLDHLPQGSIQDGLNQDMYVTCIRPRNSSVSLGSSFYLVGRLVPNGTTHLRSPAISGRSRGPGDL